jgi:hypothetical protein
MFVNAMKQPDNVKQYMFAIKDDVKHGSYVYNRFMRLNREENWYFSLSPNDFSGINGLVDAEVLFPNSNEGCICNQTRNAAINRFFEENMIDANRFPRVGCGNEEMKNMTFLVNFVA